MVIGFQSLRREFSKMSAKSVLFVCLGNICRSPTSEAILRHLVEQKGERDQWIIDSAGVGDWHVGKRSDKRGLDILKRHGIPNEHRARQVSPDDFKKFQLILAFDESNVTDLDDFKPADATAKVELFGKYDPEGKTIIDDPYYGNIEGFEVMYKHCYRCCEEFLKKH